jgi:hypothetical protein
MFRVLSRNPVHSLSLSGLHKLATCGLAYPTSIQRCKCHSSVFRRADPKVNRMKTLYILLATIDSPCLLNPSSCWEKRHTSGSARCRHDCQRPVEKASNRQPVLAVLLFFYINDVHPADGDDQDDDDDGEAAVTIPVPNEQVHDIDNDNDDEYIRSGQCDDDVFNSTPIGIARPSRLDCPCDTVPKALAVAGGNRPGRAAARRQSWTTIGLA